MWVAITVGAIALAGTVFLVWFLIGLLCDRAPSVCSRVVPVRKSPDKERHRELQRGIYVDQDRAPKSERSDYYAEVSENDGYAKARVSGLIALDIRPISAGRGWRSIHPGHFDIFHERRL